jgi:hypothetical protein
MKNYQTIGIILVAVVLGYFLGMNFPVNKQVNSEISPFANQRFSGRNNQNGQTTAGANTTRGNMIQRTGGMTGSRPVNGEIIAIDDKSMTIKLPNNTSKIVLFDSGLIINKMATATATDLKVGEKVAAFGKENADGSMSVQNIQLNPQFQTAKPAVTNK